MQTPYDSVFITALYTALYAIRAQAHLLADSGDVKLTHKLVKQGLLTNVCLTDEAIPAGPLPPYTHASNARLPHG